MSLPIPPALQRARYKAQQSAFLLNCLAAHSLIRAATHTRIEPDKAAEQEVRKRYDALIARDLANVEAGLYPRELLFQLPVTEYARQIPRLLSEFPRTLERMNRGNYKDLPRDVDLDAYPAYFRRTFHWQTDGYFSKRSAELYDVGVEFLFLGMADVMRRQVIPPITRLLRRRSDGQARVLDVACGTGRTLRQLAVAHPGLKYFGLDLSPFYVQVARERLADVADVSLVAENAESMPFRDGYFDAVTSVYLFHELPRNARRNVLHEMYRVLAPGGLLVIEDSAQASEAGAIAFFLGRFSEEFHEPFYKEYLRDDLAGALGECGFVVDSSEPCFVSKVVVARKPVASA